MCFEHDLSHYLCISYMRCCIFRQQSVSYFIYPYIASNCMGIVHVLFIYPLIMLLQVAKAVVFLLI